jgi:hypothetical protein
MGRFPARKHVFARTRYRSGAIRMTPESLGEKCGLKRLLELIEPDFQPATWQAFRRQVIDGISAETVAAELGLTVNAVLIAKSRVLSHLRRNAAGLVD